MARKRRGNSSKNRASYSKNERSRSNRNGDNSLRLKMQIALTQSILSIKTKDKPRSRVKKAAAVIPLLPERERTTRAQLVQKTGTKSDDLRNKKERNCKERPTAKRGNGKSRAFVPWC
ncbi:MAG: hypothetical protein [Microviridae sp.]|nr:MAG: hypothetical protein [Microviridae sp.]